VEQAAGLRELTNSRDVPANVATLARYAAVYTRQSRCDVKCVDGGAWRTGSFAAVLLCSGIPIGVSGRRRVQRMMRTGTGQSALHVEAMRWRSVQLGQWSMDNRLLPAGCMLTVAGISDSEPPSPPGFATRQS
jgi:hypothetical protein